MSALRVTLATDGGFAAVPGLRRPLAVDADALPAALRPALDGLVAALPASAPRGAEAGAGPVRDGRRYVLTVDGGGGPPRLLAFADPVSDPALAALCDFVRAHGTPPGGAPPGGAAPSQSA